MEQPLKVLLVHNRYRLPGGEDAVFAAEREELRAAGCRVFTYERSNAEPGGALQKLLLPFSALYSFKTAREVGRLLRSEKIDIVHVHNTLLLVSPSVFTACRRAGVPAVQTLHNFRLFCANGMLLRDNAVCELCSRAGPWCAVRFGCYRNSRAQSALCTAIYGLHRLLGTYRHVYLLALTPFDQDVFERLNKRRPVFDPARLFCKPNPVPLPAWQPLPWAGRARRYVFAARLESAKGLETVVEAWRRMGGAAPELVLAGSGPLRDWAEGELAGLPVRFVGQLEHSALLRLLGESRGLIAASVWYETFALTVAEATGMGTPVVARKLGNLGVAVQEGVNGCLFEGDDPDALCRAVDRLEKLGPVLDFDSIRTDAMRYNPEQNAARLLTLYHEILAAQP